MNILDYYSRPEYFAYRINLDFKRLDTNINILFN